MLKAFDGEAGASPLGRWMEIFYRRPHVELLPAALIEALRSPGSLTGRQSLAGAVFFSEVFRRLCPDTPSAIAAMDCYVAALKVEGFLGPSAASLSAASREQAVELLDTLLRGMWLVNAPHLDLYLHRTVSEWGALLGGGQGSVPEDLPGGEQWTEADDAAVVRSIFPPEGSRNRTHILRWPLPAMNLTAFETHLVSQPFPLYGATRYWFSHTHALRKVAHAAEGVKSRRLALLSPVLACELTKGLTDAAWSYFYATGDAVGAVSRVLDMGTPYLEFLEEYGDTWVTGADDGRQMPEDIRDSPIEAMRFESSRYALWSLLVHVRKHVCVGEAFLEHLGKVNDDAAAQDPGGTQEVLTSFGRTRLALMFILRPSLTALAIDASQDGIGSGKYPPSYSALLGGSGSLGESRALLGLGPSGPAHVAIAEQSEPACGGGAAAADVAAGVPTGGIRDRRKGGLSLRSDRIAKFGC
jgi:hypothetical protein